MPLSEVAKAKQRKKWRSPRKHRSNERLAKAFDTRELAAALDDDDGAELPLNDLSNELLVEGFEAVGDLRSVRHTVPCVCKAWDELYLTEAASPLHETLARGRLSEGGRGDGAGRSSPWPRPRREGRGSGAGSSPPCRPCLEGYLMGREAPTGCAGCYDRLPSGGTTAEL